MNAYDVVRQTQDIDFMIASEAYPKARKVFETAGFKEFEQAENFSRWKGRAGFPVIVDFVFTDTTTIAQILHYGVEKKIAGCTIKVPALDHLIAMKLHAIKQQPERRMWKDWLDILKLIERNKVDVRKEDFHTMCLKFGTSELSKDFRS